MYINVSEISLHLQQKNHHLNWDCTGEKKNYNSKWLITLQLSIQCKREQEQDS